MSSTLGFSTTAEEAATAFAKEIKGKNVLITGTSLNGIGFEYARVVAPLANLVIITGYNAERLKLSEEAIKKETPSANIRTLTLDLSSLEATRKAAAEVNKYSEPIHVLVNNAAAAIGPYKLTVDGLESQFATDHLAPFLFTNLIVPRILAAKTATYTPRIIFVASAAHAFGGGVPFDDLTYGNGANYGNFPAYFGAKSANILNASELAKKLKGKVNVYSLHPGLIYTNINVNAPQDDLKAFGMTDAEGKPSNDKFQWKTIPQGAATSVTASFDPSLDNESGSYLDDNKVANQSVAPHTSDPANATKLWALSEKLVGETFTF